MLIQRKTRQERVDKSTETKFVHLDALPWKAFGHAVRTNWSALGLLVQLAGGMHVLPQKKTRQERVDKITETRRVHLLSRRIGGRVC